MKKKYFFNFNLLLFKEDEFWIAQGINKDITAQGKSIDNAINSFKNICINQMILDFEDKKEPLSDIPEAPREFIEIFNKSENKRLKK